MSFGLNKFLKAVFPKSLFYRSLIIVAAPTILLQIIVTIVFFDSVWIKSNKGMTRALVSELKTLHDVYINDKSNLDYLTASFKNNFNFEITIKKEVIPKKSFERRFSPMDRSLRRELKSAFGNGAYWFNTLKYKEAVVIKIKTEDEIIEFIIPKDKIAPSSVRLFLLWITLPSFLLILIAIIFLKNQTRPIVNLAKAAERFGKGDFISEIRPSGALEIRKAAYEFDRMIKRINRHLTQRSEMLSGISHDLRTPLTRLKLQLAMLEQKEISIKMSKDIDEMEKMLNDYLSFAKTQTQEETTAININDFFNEIIKQHHKKAHLNIEGKIVFVGRQNALKRCLNNIIENGFTYGGDVYIKVYKSSNRLYMFIEDNGEGIPVNEYKNIFKPFYRLDKSRSLNKSGVGLGMSIAEDIIKSHGGNIQLGDSDYNGLLVKISLPF